MARIDAASLATGGLSSAVGGVALDKLKPLLPAQTTTLGKVLCYAVPLAAGLGGAYLANSGRGMSQDIGQGIQAAGFTALGMELARKMIP